MIRKVAEETGRHAVVERLLGVDSRIIPATESHLGRTHQNVGVFYRSARRPAMSRPYRSAA